MEENKTPKLIMTLLARDEADIVRYNIDFHLSHGVDFIIATDNGSLDGTREILKEYEDKGLLFLIDEPEHNYDQANWVNRMGRIALDKYKADIIFHCDADEFWYPKSGNLKNEIFNNKEIDVLSVDVINVLLEDKQGQESFPKDTKWAVTKPIETINYEEDSKTNNFYLFKYPPKVMFKTNKVLPEVVRGNHSLKDEFNYLKKEDSKDINIFHFPLRNKNYFLKRVKSSGEALINNKWLKKGESFHMKRWYESYKNGKIDEDYKKIVIKNERIAELKSNGIVIDFDFNELINTKNKMWKYNNPKFEYEDNFQDLAWPWAGHKYFAYDLISNLKPEVIVELGTHYGTSLWSFSQAVKDYYLDTEINAVDTWVGEKHAGFYGEEVFKTVNDIKNKYYPNLKINLIRKKFDEALSLFEDNSIDILHVDGLHTYEAVKNDFENWIPKVKEGGIILFHDIMVSRDDFGVYKLWEELKNNYKTLEFGHSYGLGVLIKGKNSLFDKKKELELNYSYLVEDIENKKISEIIFSLKNKEEIISQKEKNIKELELKLEDKNEIINQKELELKNKEEIINQKNIQLNAILNSTIWKITKPMRNISDKIKRLIALIKYSLVVFKNEGIFSLIKRIARFFYKKVKNISIKQNIFNNQNFSKTDSLYSGVISIDEIKNIIKSTSIEVISFDIFDTLLIRPLIDPRDIFYLISSKVDKKYNIDFIKIRYNAEAKLNKKNANINDIYNFIKKEYKISDELINILINEELYTEQKILKPRKDIKEIYDFAVQEGKEIIAISDMYLPSSFLKEILHSNGYKNINTIYVSNEIHARKDEGELYDFVVEDLKIEKSKILHIGDNYHSDYLQAINKNITAIYYPSVKDIVLNNNTIYSKIYSNNVSEDPFVRILMGFIFNQVFSDRKKVEGNKKVFSDILMFTGLQLFPMLIFTVLKIIQNKEIKEKYSEIFFASRDGYLPKKIYDLFNKRINFLPSKYLYSGRRAYYMLSEDNFFKYLKNLETDKNQDYTLENIIDCYILDDNFNKKLKSFYKNNLNISFEKNRDKCLYLLSENKKEILSYINKLKNNTINYYKQEIGDFKERAIIFDCGYSGSISKSIGNAVKTKIDKIYLWETSVNQKLDKQNKTATFTLFKERHPTEHIILEEIFSSLEGGCIGFEKKDNFYVPLLEKINISDQMYSDKKMIEDYAVFLTSEFLDFFDEYLLEFNIKDRELLQKSGWFAFGESQYNEEKLFKDIIFKDNIYLANNNSLSEKILINRKYKNVFDATGFNNENNYIKELVFYKNNCNFNIGIHLHLYNIYMYSEILSYLKDFPCKFDLIITYTDKDKENILKNIFNKGVIKELNNLILKLTPNRGRDVAPWLIYTKEDQQNYDIFCHIHSKESSHFSFNNKWRSFLFRNLIDKNAVIGIINLFDQNKNLGCVYPECFPSLKNIIINNNISVVGEFGEEKIINNLLLKMKINKQFLRYDLRYSMGTMLWYRPEALRPLFDLSLKIEDFPEEPIGVGGTIAHAIERLPSFVAESKGYESKFYTHFRE